MVTGWHVRYATRGTPSLPRIEGGEQGRLSPLNLSGSESTITTTDSTTDVATPDSTDVETTYDQTIDWTPEHVKALLSSEDKVGNAEVLVAYAAHDFTSEIVRSTEAKANNVTKCALATYAAEKADIIYGDSPTMTTSEFASRFGVGATNVPAWRKLGHALMVVGISPTSETYRRLQRDSAAARFGDVAKAIMADGATPESVEAVVATHYDDKGKQIAKARGARPADGTPKSIEAALHDSTEHLKSCLVAVKALGEHAPKLNRDDFSTVESAVEKMLADVIAARTVVVDGAATGASTGGKRSRNGAK